MTHTLSKKRVFMRKLLLLLFCTIISLLLIPSCGNENQEINFGMEFIKDFYNVDKPSVDINNSSVEDLEIGRGRLDEQAGAFIENKRDLIDELGDVLGNIAVIVNK